MKSADADPHAVALGVVFWLDTESWPWRVADHLIIADLERRFRSCPEPIEARHLQVIWLLAQGHTVGTTSKVTSFGKRWIEQVLERYNASGPGALGGIAIAVTAPSRACSRLGCWRW